MNKINKKGFTIIELLITIAVLSILVLIGMPRLLGYTEKAELTRIQHDVKVMENEMGEVLNANNQEFDNFQSNGKDLGRVILRKELFEKEGLAGNVSWDHLSAKWMYANSSVSTNNDDLGMGGDLIQIDDKYSTYKIIPKKHRDKINTKLKGTFYVNSLGKVYYEHDKPLNKVDEKESLACVAPSTLGYEFEIIGDLGTITGWDRNATHLVIPASFKMSDEDKEWCEPVRAIGAGAFQNKDFTKVTIPQSVEEIQEDAFQGGQLIEIEVPHSVKRIKGNAFAGNPATSGGVSSSIVVKGSSSGRTISSSAFGGFSFTYAPVTAKDLGVIVKTKTNGSGVKTVSIVGKSSFGGTSGSGTSSGNTGSSTKLKDNKEYSNSVIAIPKEIEVNGEVLPVTEVDSGAFQGSGLIDVIMPEGLLYIHDYAFAGNQLIRAIIPNSVIEVGNYAFAYNEIDSEPTITPINILKSKFDGDFSDVDNEGNLGQSVNPINLKNHIFITSSMGKHIIEDVGENIVGDNENNDKPNGPIRTEDEINENESKIYTSEDLNNVRNELDDKYVLMADIDLSGTNWAPIGNGSSSFTGNFDGNGFKITGLTINRQTQNYVGLFGYTQGATIENVGLENVSVTGNINVGGLVGYANSSSISDSYATGEVTGSGHQYVGGLVGQTSKSSISNSYTTGSVTGSNSVGGLVGLAYNSSSISDSYSTGSVNGSSDYVGGLVGRTDSSSSDYYSSISNSYATGAVTGNSNVGGLVGWTNNSTKIENSYATGSVTGNDRVGGLVGYAYNSTITNSYATGSVNGTGTNVGGLVGQASKSTEIDNSYATGKVTGGSNYTGGLVGQASNSTITNSYAKGSVAGGNSVGGLVGYAGSSTITNSYATGRVKGGSYIGGLVGYAYNSTITNSYWDTNTTGQNSSPGGGTGKNTNEMKKQATYEQATYSDWNFDTIWAIDEGESYPYLRANPQ